MTFNPHLPLESAKSIESWWYYDRGIFTKEKLAIFKSSWIYTGKTTQLQNVGSFFTTQIGDEPIVVVRNENGIDAFANVCQHRGTVLSEGCGHMNKFICPYHGWTYDLKGKLLGCTEPDGLRLNKNLNGLAEFEVRNIGPWIFTNQVRHPGFSFENFIKGLRLPSLDGFTWHSQEIFDIKCNWKVFVDNYLDGGYHIPYAHKSLAAVVDYSKYKTELTPFIVIQTVPLDGEVRKGMAYYVWLFPNFMINVSDGAIDTNYVVPVDEENCRVIFDFYFTPEFSKREDSKIVSNKIQQEDIKICERVQQGLHSERYNTGHYHAREEGIYHFHKLIHRFIG